MKIPRMDRMDDIGGHSVIVGTLSRTGVRHSLCEQSILPFTVAPHVVAEEWHSLSAERLNKRPLKRDDFWPGIFPIRPPLLFAEFGCGGKRLVHQLTSRRLVINHLHLPDRLRLPVLP